MTPEKNFWRSMVAAVVMAITVGASIAMLNLSLGMNRWLVYAINAVVGMACGYAAYRLFPHSPAAQDDKDL